MWGVCRRIFCAYEACAVDIWRASRGSWLITFALFWLYVVAFCMGLLIGAVAYEAVHPLLVRAFASPIAAISFQFTVLLLFLFAASSATCIGARLAVRGITYLCFEMRGNVIFHLTVLGTILCALTTTASALLPAVISETFLIFLTGTSALVGLMLALISGWLHFRYRWLGNRRGRKFDYDIGIAWDHMTDSRRWRFGFDRSH